MRARLLRPALGLAAVSTAVLALSASAAPNTLLFEDAKGDANLVNGQGLVPGAPGNQSGPVQKADSDIISMTLASTGTTKTVKGKKTFTCTGFTATLELAAPPASNMLYRVQTAGVGNPDMYWLQYSTTAASGIATTVRHNDGAAKTTPITPAKVDGNKIIFTLNEKDLKATSEKLSFTMSNIGVDVRTSPSGVTAPQWDAIERDADKSFTPCK